MWKAIVAGLLGVMFAVRIAAQQIKSDRERDGLIGTVRQIHLGEALLSKQSDVVVEWKRTWLQIINYSADGERHHEGSRTFSVRDKVYVPDDLHSGKAIGTTYAGADTVYIIYGFDDVVKSRIVNTFDERGRRVMEAVYKADGSLVRKIVYGYGDRDTLTERVCYAADGSMTYKDIYSYEYDAVGNWIRRVTSTLIEKGACRTSSQSS